MRVSCLIVLLSVAAMIMQVSAGSSGQLEPFGAPPGNPFNKGETQKESVLAAPSEALAAGTPAPASVVIVADPSANALENSKDMVVATLVEVDQEQEQDQAPAPAAAASSGPAASGTNAAAAPANPTTSTAAPAVAAAPAAPAGPPSPSRQSAEAFLAKLNAGTLSPAKAPEITDLLLTKFEKDIIQVKDRLEAATPPKDEQKALNRKGTIAVAEKLSRALEKARVAVKQIELNAFTQTDLDALTGKKANSADANKDPNAAFEQEEKLQAAKAAKAKNKYNPLAAYSSHAKNPIHKLKKKGHKAAPAPSLLEDGTVVQEAEKAIQKADQQQIELIQKYPSAESLLQLDSHN